MNHWEKLDERKEMEGLRMKLAEYSVDKRIICFGNPYAGDDGFGPAVYQHLRSLGALTDKQVCLGGIMGLNSLGLFEACRELVIVDTIGVENLSGGSSDSTGQLLYWSFCLDSDGLTEANLNNSNWQARIHDFDLHYILKALPLVLTSLPEKIFILAAQIEPISGLGEELSRPLQLAVEESANYLWEYLNDQRVTWNG